MKQKHTVGVVVGRFQVPELHKGHRYLIDHARDRNGRLLIIIGTSGGFASAKNPLSFQARKAMIQEYASDVTVLEHRDHPSDIAWSKKLDQLIQKAFPDRIATLYGSRDSFIPHYHGIFRTEIVPEIPHVNGTLLRQYSAQRGMTTEFRKGIIHAHMAREPIPYPAVDIAIIHPERHMVLLGTKAIDEGMQRFIGGFVDPRVDQTLEDAARRESYEETGGLEIADLKYLGSSMIEDVRYRGSNDRIISTFFVAQYIFGAPIPSDDIDRLQWTPINVFRSHLVPQHQHFGALLNDHLFRTMTNQRSAS